ncbi:MAG TPA: protein kinase, partial [Kineosporiaceae bacterium]
MGPFGHRYLPVEQIARGGMSVVWRGHDEVLDRPVAIKVLDPEYVDDQLFRDRIRREARAAARLSHPHVGVVHDFGEAPDGRPYLVMELINGLSLADRLLDGPLPPAQALTICAQVAAALSEAHAHGLVHRDVKPGNVMLSASGAKLVDFGISALLSDPPSPDPGEGSAPLPTSSPASSPGSAAESPPVLLGTPAYVAPELVTRNPAGPAADVYALGVLLYQTLTGRLPWPLRTSTELLRAHVLWTPPPLPPVAGLPSDVLRVSQRCLAKDPGDRPGCATLAAAWSTAAHLVEAAARSSGDPRSSGGSAPVARESGAQPGEEEGAEFPRTTQVRIGLPAAEAGRSTGRLQGVTLTGVASVLLLAGATAGSFAGGRTLLLNLTRTPPASRPAPALAGDRRPATSAESTAPAAGSPCGVVYLLHTDDGHRFSGVLTVRNTGPHAVSPATLTFAFPAGQKVTGASLRQDGAEVSIFIGTLPPGGAGRFTFSGRYDGLNAMPAAFRLDRTPCTAQAVGVVSPPVRPDTARTSAPNPRANPATSPPRPTSETSPIGPPRTDGTDLETSPHDTGTGGAPPIGGLPIDPRPTGAQPSATRPSATRPSVTPPRV